MGNAVVESLERTYPVAPESLPRARADVTAFAIASGMSGGPLQQLRIAASEAISNAILHAYPEGPGEIRVTGAVVSDELWLLVADGGCGLGGSRADSAGLGLGLGLMARFSDDLTLLSASSGGLEVRMQFSLGPRERAEDRIAPVSASRGAASRVAASRGAASGAWVASLG